MVDLWREIYHNHFFTPYQLYHIKVFFCCLPKGYCHQLIEQKVQFRLNNQHLPFGNGVFFKMSILKTNKSCINHLHLSVHNVTDGNHIEYTEREERLQKAYRWMELSFLFWSHVTEGSDWKHVVSIATGIPFLSSMNLQSLYPTV